jgi:HK97 family phage prohead protease
MKQHYIKPELLQYKSFEQSGEFSGYASIFHSEDLVGDVILPGAFKSSIGTSFHIKLLWQHNPEEPIGVITNIFEDERGLFINGRFLLELNKAKEAYTLVKNEAIKGLSIGYQIEDFFFDKGIRYITKVKLLEVSLVTFPANQEAGIIEVKGDRIKQLIASIEALIDKVGRELV